MIGFNNLRVSITIPVYNEEARIAACLESIAAQSVAPYEVIVVDNNSTDNTREVVAGYPFARLISAQRQGVIHARNRGFNAVHGDIIGRIDADTHLPVDWVATVQQVFITSNVSAISGAVRYYDIPLSGLLSRIDLSLRRHAARRMDNEVYLQGANMALRTSAWRAVKNHLCARGDMHEDFDLAIHLSDAGYEVAFCEQLRASISARPLDDTVRDFWKYVLLSPGTYAQHNRRSQRAMYPMVLLGLVFHVPLRALYRGANSDAVAYQRVNPATFVD